MGLTAESSFVRRGNLTADPRERNNLAASQAGTLQSMVKAWSNGTSPSMPVTLAVITKIA